MAKCIKNIKSNKVFRVSDKEAEKKIDSKEYEYISKSMYRRHKIQEESNS